MADQADQSEQADLVERAVDRLVPEADPTHSGSSATTAGILVWAYLAGRELEVWLADALGATGLTTSEFGALAGVAFAGEHTLTAGDLARWTVQTSGGTTKTIQRLVDRGLVHRVADPADGRRTLIDATDDGRHLAATVVTDLVARLDRDLDPLDTRQRDDLHDGLRRLSAALGWQVHADGPTATGRTRD
jgi:DNA-binding MarR family transcriptional regulator